MVRERKAASLMNSYSLSSGEWNWW